MINDYFVIQSSGEMHDSKDFGIVKLGIHLLNFKCNEANMDSCFRYEISIKEILEILGKTEEYIEKYQKKKIHFFEDAIRKDIKNALAIMGKETWIWLETRKCIGTVENIIKRGVVKFEPYDKDEDEDYNYIDDDYDEDDYQYDSCDDYE